jgi:hypothetical protein
MGALSSQPGTLRTATRVAKMALWRSVGRSDYARWGDVDSLETWWESRTQTLARMIPDGTRVLEFGAGRRRLAAFLGPRCTYMASDLVDRGGDTFICDLNRRPLPELGPLRPQVAVFAGVLEYVRDVPAVVAWLAPHVSACVASYAGVHRGGLWNRLAVSANRTYYGYMNSYSEPELIAIFTRHGFRCVRTESWNDQRLYRFETWPRETRP